MPEHGYRDNRYRNFHHHPSFGTGAVDGRGAKGTDAELKIRRVTMNEVLQKMHEIGIIPVVVLNDAKDAEPLGKALLDRGLPCAEVTFRTDVAEESIRIMSEKFPDLLVGAGTVLTTEQVDRAIAAGAKFIVSPGLNPKVVQYCIDKNIPITPGVVTPGEIEKAIELGLEVVKFFPAEPPAAFL